MNAEFKESNGGRLLHWSLDRPGVLKLLLEHGADPDIRTKEGYTALHGFPSPERVEILIAAGADIEAKNNRGWTPLHVQAAYLHPEVVQLLVEKGADVSAKTSDGETALDLARKARPYSPDTSREKRRAAVIDFLLTHGAKE